MSDNAHEKPMQRSDGRFHTRYYRRNPACLLAGVVALIFTWQRFDGGWPFWLSLGAFLGYIVVALCSIRWRLRHYQCPDCGLHLPKPIEPFQAGIRLRYYCPNCNVEWDTMIIGPDAGSGGDNVF
jgi:predicted RNA-binding Zn-ribbon protein involved in translation (DUF1610 family)